MHSQVHAFLQQTCANIHQYQFNNPIVSPLGKGQGPSFAQTWIPFTQECFVPIKFGWNWPSGSGEENEI